MAICYKPLFRYLLDNDITKTQMRLDLNLSTVTLAKMGKSEYVSLQVIDKICSHYGLQPGQVIEWKENE